MEKQGKIPLENGLNTFPLSEYKGSCPFELKDKKGVPVGKVTSGYICNSLSLEGVSGIRLLPSTVERGTYFASSGMKRLLSYVSKKLKKRFPEVKLPLGNIAKKGGGDIPFSVSHNNGRDVDIFFLMFDRQGNQYFPYKVRGINTNFTATDDGKTYFFDIDKNLYLIKLLLSHPKVKVQWIFCANFIKRALIRAAIRKKYPQALITKINTVLKQPSTSLPHDDHFHVRIYCTPRQYALGCKDLPPFWNFYDFEDVNKVSDSFIKKLIKNNEIEFLYQIGARNVYSELLKKWDRMSIQNKIVSLKVFSYDLPASKLKNIAKKFKNEKNPLLLYYYIDFLFRKANNGVAFSEIKRFFYKNFTLKYEDTEFSVNTTTRYLVLKYAGVFGTKRILEFLLKIYTQYPEVKESVAMLSGFLPRELKKKWKRLRFLSLLNIKKKALKDFGYRESERYGSLLAIMETYADDKNSFIYFNACYVMAKSLRLSLNSCIEDSHTAIRWIKKLLVRKKLIR